ncbi:2'-deoxymugineic-acid 2'-dioxygenase [Hordeum vulgare subsp. vulgare]|uniref:2'-deoxymugineic-acid 2'-dioxygenase n=2 Tax=Hordeum vulgare TaxID=4513 RepID=IDS3_HORVU|nr:2'-deoxymugineic-acid 2'-dioxygenase [Hordeum vulgare subsp. vulgare]Q40062.3 RecName: Full=2'-deoxymugineic-acid 2'-dioxygenase; AltName: Full=Protein iron deficiency-specific 3 [Hordeum vulgare]BAA07042.1 Ids3 [Hordeum vulgare subsp. vulgare]
MENILHATPAHVSLPESFVFASDKVPPATKAVVSLPIIDLSCGRDEVRRSILEAGKELGFFQVVNHGVSKQVMRDMEGMCEQFFHLPAADKASLYSEERHKPNRLFSGATYDTGGEKYWRDCLRLACPFPVDDSINEWPDTPKGLRDVIEKFTSQTRDVGKELLRLLCEGMGIQADYFEGDLSGGNVILNINHYPSCPNPDKALGQPPHCDRNLITLLLPGAVNGLEVSYKGDWIKVDPAPNAFVVNFGQQLEVVTNGLLKSIEHRAMTNSALARTSVATFIMPTQECLIGPAKEFLSKENPPCYRTTMFRDFMRIYNVVKLGSSLNLTTNLKNVQKEI